VTDTSVDDQPVDDQPVTPDHKPGDESPARGARLLRWLGRTAQEHRLALVVLITYLALAVMLTANLWPDPAGLRVAGNPGDTNLYQWWFGWWLHSVGSFESPWTSYAMNWPQGVSLMANTSMAVPAFAFSWLFVTAGPLATYNVLTALAPAVSAWALYLCARRLGIRPIAAYAGGLVFGFSQAIVHSMVGHLSMALVPLLPVVVLLNILAWRTSRPRLVGLTLGVVAFVQVMTGEEVLFQAGIATVVILVVVGISRPKAILPALPIAARTYGWALLVFVPLAAYPLYVQFLGPLKMHGSPFWVDYFAADIAAFVNPTELVLRGPAPGSDAFPGGITEHLAYLGWPLILICVATLVARWADVRVRAIGVGLAVTAVLSMGGTLWVRGQQTTLELPWAWLKELPVLEAALPSRFGLVTAFFAAAMLALAAELLLASDRTTITRPVALIAAVALLWTLCPQPLPVEAVNPIPGYFTAQARDLPERAKALIIPFPTPTQTEPLRWQTAAHYRYDAPGGYFIAPGGDGHAYIGAAASFTQDMLVKLEEKGEAPDVTPDLKATVAGDLAAWGTTVVLQGPSQRQAELRALLTQLFGEPVDTNGVAVWPNPKITP
jgi:hypothetical protein